MPLITGQNILIRHLVFTIWRMFVRQMLWQKYLSRFFSIFRRFQQTRDIITSRLRIEINLFNFYLIHYNPVSGKKRFPFFYYTSLFTKWVPFIEYFEIFRSKFSKMRYICARINEISISSFINGMINRSQWWILNDETVSKQVHRVNGQMYTWRIPLSQGEEG